MECWILTRLEEDKSSKKIQDECPEGGKPGDTVSEDSGNTFPEKATNQK